MKSKVALISTRFVIGAFITFNTCIPAQDESLFTRGEATISTVSSTTIAKVPETRDTHPDELKNARARYQELVTEIEKPLYTLAGHYRGALEKLQEELQEKGDLDGLLETKGEIKKIDQTGLPSPVPQEGTRIGATRAIYEDAKLKVDQDIGPKINKLNQAFKDNLESMQTELTKAGRIDEARAVLEFAKTIKIDEANLRRPLGMSGSDSPGKLKIRVQVDGGSHAFIRGDEIWFDHTEGWASPVGLHQGVHPTELNGKEWTPVWQGKVTQKHEAGIGLPTSGDVEVKYRHKDGRGHAEILEQPDTENDYTLKLEMRDQDKDTGKRYFGSKYLEFELSWD